MIPWQFIVAGTLAIFMAGMFWYVSRLKEDQRFTDIADAYANGPVISTGGITEGRIASDAVVEWRGCQACVHCYTEPNSRGEQRFSCRKHGLLRWESVYYMRQARMNENCFQPSVPVSNNEAPTCVECAHIKTNECSYWATQNIFLPDGRVCRKFTNIASVPVRVDVPVTPEPKARTIVRING